ncbi:hypothetical protein OG585_51115 (plasmid) [Streptomyces sp. NBC_01340]|nr:hypothetical protein OG585_51115 [Streptomyces sp. NBC_01340]
MHWADEVTLALLLALASRIPGYEAVRRARVDLGVLPVAATVELVSSMLDDEHVSAAFAGFPGALVRIHRAGRGRGARLR